MPDREDQPVESPEEAPAETSADSDDLSSYADPSGLFTSPVPKRWSATPGDDTELAVLAGPDDGARVYLVAIEGTEAEEGIAQAWERVDTAPQSEAVQSMRPPAPEGVEDYLVLHYDVEDERLWQAVAQVVDGRVYVALIVGDLNEVQRRASQIQTIVSGFRPTVLQQTDLSDVEALSLTEEVLEEFDRDVQRAMEAAEVPGLSVGVVQDGEVVWERGYGLQDLDASDPVTPETLMMIGSTGKTMTTLLLAILVDQGVLSWDTPAHEILPEFSVQDPSMTERITIEHLVCACTGVPRRDMELLFNYRSLSAEAIVESLATFEFFTDFGEAFQYSNQMIAAAGYVAAAALGSEYGDLYSGYAQALQQYIYDPLEMGATTIDFDAAIASENLALGHRIGFSKNYERFDMEAERFVVPVAPAGAMWSNTQDMNKYMLALLDSDGTEGSHGLLPAKELERLWMPQVEMSADTQYGLGWIISDYQGIKVLSHGGNTMGYTSELALFPEADVGINVQVNGAEANYLTRTIRDRLLELLYDRPPRAFEHIEFGRDVVTERMADLYEKLDDEPDHDLLDEYLGAYENDALGAVTLRRVDGQFFFDTDGFTMEVRQLADNNLALVTVEPPLMGMSIKVERDDEGEQILKFGEGVVAYTFERSD